MFEAGTQLRFEAGTQLRFEAILKNKFDSVSTPARLACYFKKASNLKFLTSKYLETVNVF